MEDLITKEMLADAIARIDKLKGYLTIEDRKVKIGSLEAQTQENGFWDDNQKAQSVLKDIKLEKNIVEPWESAKSEIADLGELYELSEGDFDSLSELSEQFVDLSKKIDHLEFVRKLGGEDDGCDAIITIHSGAGGTEACDWSDMLYRMYNRWIERHDFSASVLEVQEGDEAGLKSISIEVKGEYAYGNLKAESGVHRLVRISPFDSGARRHTSFSSVYVYPVFDEVDDFDLDEKDIRVDTYRASGAGGQHINKTDSAVRMTHIPTNIVVQCQNQRSQIKNRAAAMKMLKARVRLHVKEEEERKRADKLEDKKKIEWGSQIRSYVLHPYNMVKDHRTATETSNTQAVLDGDLDLFIESYLLNFQ